MSNVASYYQDELVNWDHSLDFYQREAIQLETKLRAVIQRNTIPTRALLAEQFLNKFALLRSELFSISKQIYRQENSLKKDDIPLEDAAVTAQITGNQNDLREKMQILEKNFVDVKYDCLNFLSGIRE